MNKKNFIWGLLFILAAVLLVLNQIGYISFKIIVFLVTAICIFILVKSILRLNFYGIFFPAAIWLIYFDERLNITELTPIPALLTALLLSIAFSLIF